MVGDIPELKQKKSISMAFVVGIAIAMFTLGGAVDRVLTESSFNERIHEFIIGEVDGHRKDTDTRFNEVVKPALDELNEDVDQLREELNKLKLKQSK
jgi:hypothetical protein